MTSDDQMPLSYDGRGAFSSLDQVDIREDQSDMEITPKRFQGNQVGERYEDQVVPARRNRVLDLDAEIQKYEEDEAKRREQ